MESATCITPVFSLRLVAQAQRRAALKAFTLIEAMVVVAILAVLVSIAAPNFREFLLQTQASNLANEFLAALQQTRALAISQNSYASLCIQATGTPVTCDAAAAESTNWVHRGWIVYQHNNAAGVPNTAENCVADDPGDCEIKQVKAGSTTSAFSLSLAEQGFNRITFNAKGFAQVEQLNGGVSFNTEGSFVLAHSSGDVAYRKIICVDRAGRARVQRAADTACN